MTVKIQKSSNLISEKELNLILAKVRYTLPESFKNFLLDYNGGVPAANKFDIKNMSVSSGVNEFLSIDAIVEQKNILGERIPNEVIPIAHAECGNLICLVIKGSEIGNVYFWDHELEVEQLPSWENMFFLSSSFDELVESLAEYDAKSVKLDPNKVISAWIDPDLLKSQKSSK
jgi:hypothetical protein